MSVRTKNPLHPSALSINDLTVGRRVIRFNTHLGIIEEGVIVSRPYAKFTPDMAHVWPHGQLRIDVRSSESGHIHPFFLTDLGVIPYRGASVQTNESWSLVNILVDHRKRHLLPEGIGMPEDYLDDLLMSPEDYSNEWYEG